MAATATCHPAVCGRSSRRLRATLPAKGERRFISTIARRLDSLGALTRGQRDSQTAMGDDGAMLNAKDNLESPYARAALRQLYGTLYRGDIEG